MYRFGKRMAMVWSYKKIVRSRLLVLFYCLFSFIVNAQTADCSTCRGASPTGANYAGKNLTDYNFTVLGKKALVGANFQNAILNGAQFQNMDLTGASFIGAQLGSSAKGNTDLSGTILNHTCFINANLQNANLQFASFSATDFSCSNLLEADFGPVMNIQPSADGLRTKFNYTRIDFIKFPIINWQPSDWANTDLSYTRFTGMSSKNFSLRGKNISGALLKGIDFTGYDLGRAILTGVDFTGATLIGADMDSTKMNQVQLVKAKLQNAELIKVSFYDSTHLSAVANLTGAVFNNANLHAADMRYTTLSGTSFQGATMDSILFNNANFESNDSLNAANLSGANLSYSNFAFTRLNGVNFRYAYLVGAQFPSLTLLATDFTGATMPGANFNNSTLEAVSFSGAILQNAIFTSVTFQKPPGGLSGVDLSCSQLGGANFSSSTILQANFSNAVMLDSTYCCKTLDGYLCGYIAINELAYSTTTFPKLTVSVNCPNGDFDICKGAQWVVPGWQTNGCNTQHTTQTIWYKPDCSGGHDTADLVKFKDPNLQQCVIDKLMGGDASKPITKQLAAQVTALACPCRQISDLTGLENFTAMQQLDMSCNNLTGSSVFQRLLQLQKLKVSDNQITSLNLFGLKKINYLDASNNALTSVLFDASAYLNYLDLSYNHLSTMDVSIQTILNYLDLSHNQLTSIGKLNQLTSLSTLYLENNSLTTIGYMADVYDNGNGNLQYMNLACNKGFLCNTLGLDSTQTEIDFLTQSQCGVNNIPGCNTASLSTPNSVLPTKMKQKKKSIKRKQL